MLGEKELIQVFVPVPLADISKSNVTESSISGYAKYVPDPDAPKDSVNVTYKFELPEYTGEYYFYQTGVYPRKIKIYANGKNLGDYFDGTFNSRIVSLGKFNAGEDLSVRTVSYTHLYSGCLLSDTPQADPPHYQAQN